MHVSLIVTSIIGEECGNIKNLVEGPCNPLSELVVCEKLNHSPHSFLHKYLSKKNEGGEIAMHFIMRNEMDLLNASTSDHLFDPPVDSITYLLRTQHSFVRFGSTVCINLKCIFDSRIRCDFTRMSTDDDTTVTAGLAELTFKG